MGEKSHFVGHQLKITLPRCLFEDEEFDLFQRNSKRACNEMNLPHPPHRTEIKPWMSFISAFREDRAFTMTRQNTSYRWIIDRHPLVMNVHIHSFSFRTVFPLCNRYVTVFSVSVSFVNAEGLKPAISGQTSWWMTVHMVLLHWCVRFPSWNIYADVLKK